MRKIIVRDKIYIPTKFVDLDSAEYKYTHRFYEESACFKCDNLEERHNYICSQCPAFKGEKRTYRYKEIKNKDYIGLPLGARSDIVKLFDVDMGRFQIIDKRTNTDFDYDIEFTGQLRDYQLEAAKKWYKSKFGFIVAPPRSGKTILMLYLMIKLGKVSVLLASQHEFLNQFLEHVEEFSNLPELQRSTKSKLFGFPKTEKDFKTMQIMCCTYQQFMNNREKFKWLAKRATTVFIDEAHKANAEEFSIIVDKIPARYRAGFTATKDRKDGKQVVMHDIVGPVRFYVKRQPLTPKLTVHITENVKPKSAYNGPAGWVYAMQFLSKHKERNKQILKLVLKDLKKGRSIVLPLMFKAHVTEMTDSINRAYGSKIAESFMGGGSKANKLQREKTIERARSGEVRVVVGIRSLLQLGLNVVRWDCVTGDTLVPTKKGLIRIEDMCPKRGIIKYVNDVHRGDKYAKTKISGYTGKQFVKEITTKSGVQINASFGQKILILRSDMSTAMVRADEIVVGDNIILSSAGNVVSELFPLPASMFYMKVPEKVTNKLAYVIGAFSGDGRITISPKDKRKHVNFYNNSELIINRIKRFMSDLFGVDALRMERKRVREVGACVNYELNFKRELYDFFDTIGLSGKSYTKEVPACILQSPKEIQASYLAGLIDTDGFVSTSKINILGITTSSYHKVKQLQQMVFHSFGILGIFNPQATPGVCSIDGSNCNYPNYCLRFSGSSADRLLPYLKNSIKCKTLKSKFNALSIRKPDYLKVPYIKELYQSMKKINGVYKDVAGNRLDIKFSKLISRAKLDLMKEDKVDISVGLLDKKLSKNIKNLLSLASAIETVKCIETSENKRDTYDLTMEDSTVPRFNANGMIIHNCLYYIIPLNNEPNWRQESSRILTPDDDNTGKGAPLIRMFVDEKMGQSTGCFVNTWIQSMKMGYKATDVAKERAYSMMSQRKKKENSLYEESKAVYRESKPSLFRKNKF